MRGSRPGRQEGEAVSQHDLTYNSALTTRIPASVDAPAIARSRFVAQAGPVLDPGRLEDARLLVSEVVTNAVRHAGLSSADEITVHVRAEHGAVVVEIADPGRGFNPLPRSEAAVGGWGLPLVQRLSDGWGVEPRAGGGSTVWFRIGRRD